jgi:hypothetical protein
MLPDKFRVSFVIRPKHLLVSPLGVLAAIGLFYLPWGAESAPAWAQAVGSVAAIAAAIWISNRQQHQAAIERRRQNYRYMFRAFQVASNAVATMCTVLEDIQEGRLAPSNISYYKAVLGSSANELSQLSFKDMVDYEFGRVWIDIIRHVTLIKSRIEDHASEPALIPRAMDIPLALVEVPKQLEELQQLLAEHSTRVGPEVYQDQHL